MMGRRNSGSDFQFNYDFSDQVRYKCLPNVPPFLNDNFRTTPSIKGPASKVPNKLATKLDRFVRPTAETEKLYGGAEKIWESVMEIPTSHDIQVVKSKVAHNTAGELSITNGRKTVLRNET